GDGGGGDRRRGEPRRAASPAAGIATAVLLQVGVVGMARTERLRDVAVVLAARVLVADQQRDRGAGGLPLVHAGENLDLVGLPSLRRVARGAGAAPVEIGLDVGLRKRQAGRTTVDHAAERGP